MTTLTKCGVLHVYTNTKIIKAILQEYGRSSLGWRRSL